MADHVAGWTDGTEVFGGEGGEMGMLVHGDFPRLFLDRTWFSLMHFLRVCDGRGRRGRRQSLQPGPGNP